MDCSPTYYCYMHKEPIWSIFQKMGFTYTSKKPVKSLSQFQLPSSTRHGRFFNHLIVGLSRNAY